MGTNKYPKSKTNGKKLNHKAEGTEVAFAQTKDISEVTCYHCGNKGHYAKTCPEKEAKRGQVHTQLSKAQIEESDVENELGYIYHQNLLGLNWKTCLLIDSESSIDIFNNNWHTHSKETSQIKL